MCTVTYVPTATGSLLTSSRDEAVLRAPAKLPDLYHQSTGKVLYPKDGEAGGTWIAVHQNRNIMVLLNGAFEKHRRTPPYRKSRGLVFLDVFDGPAPQEKFSALVLEGIEPFTLVALVGGGLWEMRWDGVSKHISQPDTTIPHIWSSVTLYSEPVRRQRVLWFNELLQTGPLTQQHLLNFHRFGGANDIENGINMNRSDLLRTVSITSIELTADKYHVYYKDMVSGLQKNIDWMFASKCPV